MRALEASLIKIPDASEKLDETRRYIVAMMKQEREINWNGCCSRGKGGGEGFSPVIHGG